MSIDKKLDENDVKLTRQRLSEFARRLSVEWRKHLWPVDGSRVVMAVSGGADSTALALAFEELIRNRRLNINLTVAHFNHRLRGRDSDEDARWVEELADALGFDSVVGNAQVSGETRRENVEQAARRARYRFLHETALASGACAVVTAHTLDDQAETILLRLMRGSGAEGLTGMRPERALVEARDDVRLLRPLLGWARRAETENYCRKRGVSFRLDEMNEDESFARVRVRHRLLPLMESFNPRVVETLVRTAELLRDDDATLNREASRLLENALVEESVLRVEVLAAAPKALRRRALRLWLAERRGDLRRIELVHLRAVEKLLEGERGGRVAELPGGGMIERRRSQLRFIKRVEVEE